MPNERLGGKAERQKRQMQAKHMAEELGLPVKDLVRETERALVRVVAEHIANGAIKAWRQQSQGEMRMLFAGGATEDDVAEAQANVERLQAELGLKK